MRRAGAQPDPRGVVDRALAGCRLAGSALVLSGCAARSPAAITVQISDRELESLHGAMLARAEALGATEGSEHEGPGFIVGGTTEAWCTGPARGAGCSDHREDPGRAWIEATRLRDDRGITGLQVDIGNFPTPDGWGLRARVGRVDGEEEVDLLWVKFVNGAVTDRFQVGTQTRIDVAATPVSVQLPTPGESELSLLKRALRSDAAFRAWVSARVVAVQQRAHTALVSGEVERCSYGEYTGDRNVICERIPLPPGEVPGWHTSVDERSMRVLSHLRDDAPALRALVRGALPI